MMPRLLRKERASRRHKENIDGPAAGGRSQERPPPPASFPVWQERVAAIASPKTFDACVALYGVSALLSLTGTALVIKRKKG